jgi:hypothetical protein
MNDKGEFAENWRNVLSDDIKDSPAIGAFRDLGSFVKSYLNAQKMIGADKIALPGKNATPEERAEFFKKIGRPEKPEDYKFERPKDAPPSLKYDEAREKAFASEAHKLGLTAEQAVGLAGWWNNHVVEMDKSAAKAHDEKHTAAVTALQKEWGDKYAANVELANSAVRTFGLADFLKERGLSNDPEMVKAFSAIGGALSEDKLLGPKSASGIGGAMSRINELMNNLKGPYYDKSHPAHAATVAEVQKLYAQAYPEQK